MKSIVTYKEPGIETTIEQSSKLSKRQVIFVVTLPLIFLIGGLSARILVFLFGAQIAADPVLSTMIGFVFGIFFFLVVIPKVFRMPNGKTTIRRYLNDIGVDRIRPISRTLLIYLPCFFSIIGAQIAGSLVYNHFILRWDYERFLMIFFNPNRIIPWIGLSPIISIGSVFEEIVLRGVVLTMLLQVYSERTAIIGSAVAFGYVHILNLLNGPITYASLVFVAGQITWSTIIGLLYGIMFLRTGNLYANMLLHWTANGLSNCFMYMPFATPELHALFNIIFNIGLMSTTLSILWVVLVNRLWPLTKPVSDMHYIS
jgi:membrane protease YdiL (CAAX protease family)